ncbi:MAG TPA: FlgO family outer membrane protein [Chthonomonadaceae bacterium]|nr:FlgO family outer membrane protein [Chthonomonadaceae bacterium]
MFHLRAFLIGCILLLPLASYAADPPAPDQPPVSHTIAVADFSGADPEVGRFIAETLLTDLAQSRVMHFAERSEIRRALDELKLQSTGLIDPQQVSQLGKLVSADRLIVGSYLEADDQIIINARLLDVGTGRLAEGGSGNVSGERRNLLSLVHRLAHQFHRRVSGEDFVIDGEGADPPSRLLPPSNTRGAGIGNGIGAHASPTSLTSPRPFSDPIPKDEGSGYRVTEPASNSSSPHLDVPPLVSTPTRPSTRLGVPWRRRIPPPPYPYGPVRIQLDTTPVNYPPAGAPLGWRIQ